VMEEQNNHGVTWATSITYLYPESREP